MIALFLGIFIADEIAPRTGNGGLVVITIGECCNIGDSIDRDNDDADDTDDDDGGSGSGGGSIIGVKKNGSIDVFSISNSISGSGTLISGEICTLDTELSGIVVDIELLLSDIFGT